MTTPAEHPHKAEIEMLREKSARDDAKLARFESFAEAHRVWDTLDPDNPAAIKHETVVRLRDEALAD